MKGYVKLSTALGKEPKASNKEKAYDMPCLE